ncbi:MAG: hypothetical protein ACJ77B_04735 [Chloroflexota bacterium]
MDSGFGHRPVARGEPGFFSLLVGDGRAPLALVAVGLIVAGAFAFFLSATGELLPHDIAYLGMSAADLKRFDDGRVLDFMFHDRVAFGGTLVAVGTLYLWLIAVPLASGERWAWRLLAGTGVFGFLSFFAYIGYGYFDSWHAAATGALLVPFVVGLNRTRASCRAAPARNAWRPRISSAAGIGRALLLLTATGMIVAGLTIVTIGAVVVFVPQDTAFLGLDRSQLEAINPHLVPLIAHDRAGFGGALATTGFTVAGIVWRARPSRALWQAILVAGSVGFGAAIGIHGLIGYIDLSHVGPAIAGAAVFAVGIAPYPRAAAPEAVAADGTAPIPA